MHFRPSSSKIVTHAKQEKVAKFLTFEALRISGHKSHNPRSVRTFNLASSGQQSPLAPVPHRIELYAQSRERVVEGRTS